MCGRIPKISIIIPVYKVENYLERCVQSVLKQTYPNLEIILVDDGSPDNCGTICDNYANENSNVSVIHQKNQGISAARNNGMKVAKGDFFGFVDSDDIIEPDMYERLYENIKKTNAEISIGRFIDCDENGKANANSEKCKEEIKVLACKDAIESLLIDNGWVTSHACNKLFKKELFDSLEFPVGKVYEDSFVIIDLLLKAKTVVSDAHGIYRYCHRKDSIVETKFTEKNMDLLEAWEKNKNQIIEYFPELNKEVEFRYLWVCCYLYDKCMLNENRCDQEQELRKILKNNFVDILKNPYFRMTRKIALCVLRVSTAAYREGVRRKLSVID